MFERVTTVRSSGELAGLFDTWRELEPRDSNADPDVLRVLLETRAEVLRPHIVLAEAGERRALLVGRIDRTRLPVRLGYKTLYAPWVRALNVAQGGVLGAGDDAFAAAFNEAYAALRAREADVLRLRALPVGSPLHRLASERVSWRTRGRTQRPSPRWRLFLPSTLDEILQLHSRKSRGNEQRSMRRLEQEFGDRLSFQAYRHAADIPRVLRDCSAVSARTYQRALGAGFAPDGAERRLLQLAAERGWMRAYVLSVDGEPQAFWVGNAYGRVFQAGPTGYNATLAHLRPGRYVLLRMLEDLCADPDVEEVDWGIGDAEYKRHFATHGWLEEDVLVFAPTFRGVRVNLTRTALLSATGGVRRVADRVPALRDVKRRWRARLAPEPERPREPRRLPRVAFAALVVALMPVMLFGAVVASAALDRPATTMHDEMIVNAPGPLVWNVLTEFEGYDTWNPYITQADGTARRGAEIDLRIEPHGEPAAQVECDVVTVKHLRELHWRCSDYSMPGLLDRKHVFRLLPTDGSGERVRLVYEGRWEGILVPFTELRSRKAGYLRMIFALKRHAELAG